MPIAPRVPAPCCAGLMQVHGNVDGVGKPFGNTSGLIRSTVVKGAGSGRRDRGVGVERAGIGKCDKDRRKCKK